MTLSRFFAICIILLSVVSVGGEAAQSAAATSQEATGSISGHVITEKEGAACITVLLLRAIPGTPPKPAAQATTDKMGNFKLTYPAAGRYYLLPLAPSIKDFFGEPGNYGTEISLGEGENVEGIELLLPPAGEITGRVTDSNGEPVKYRRIYAEMINISNYGRGVWTSKMFATDSHGIYRIRGLSPGNYFVIIPADNKVKPPITTFAPGVTVGSKAKAISVMPGEIVEYIDIKMEPTPRIYRVSGRVLDDAMEHIISGVTVGWAPVEYLDKHRQYAAIHRVNEKGEFHFDGLLSGRHAVVLLFNYGGGYYSNRVTFEVSNQDVTGLEIRARRGGSLSGTIVIEGEHDPANPIDLSQLGVSAMRKAGGTAAIHKVGTNGQFLIPGLPPDKYNLRLHSDNKPQRLSLLGVKRDSNWVLESIEVADGQHLTGLSLIAAYGAGVVRGQVQVVGGTLPNTASLKVSLYRAGIPGSRNFEGSSNVDEQGRFLFERLATGVYDILLIAVEPWGLTLRPISWSVTIKQTITVKSGAESEVTFVLDLHPSNLKKPKQN
jgi:hypothetical protein